MGMIKKDEVPPKWGLLEVTHGRGILPIVRPEIQERNYQSEINILTSMVRRLNILPDGHVSIKKYEPIKGLAPSKNRATFYITEDRKMSCTEIYGFDKEGTAYLAAEIQNSWRGGMAIWRILEEKYLPLYRPLSTPAHIPNEQIESYLGYKPSRCRCLENDIAMKEIWNLVDSDNVSFTDKIVLATTLDKVIIRKDELPMVIKAFNDFEGETSLKEQAEILDKMYKDDKCTAVGWNQTSVNSDTWDCYGYDEELDESIPYNLNKNDKHWFLFDELKQQ